MKSVGNRMPAGYDTSLPTSEQSPFEDGRFAGPEENAETAGRAQGKVAARPLMSGAGIRAGGKLTISDGIRGTRPLSGPRKIGYFIFIRYCL